MILTSFITASPLKNLFPYGCEIFYFLAVGHNALLVCGGFMMGIFRLVCVQFGDYIKISLDTMVTIELWVQYAWIGFLISGYCVAAQTYGSANILEFCRGYTTEVPYI